MRRRVRIIMLRTDIGCVTYTAGVTRRGVFRQVGKVEVLNSLHGYYYLRRLHVYPEHRQRGVATRLMRKALRDTGRKRVELIANPEWDGGLGEAELARFYHKFGFDYAPSAWTDRDERDSDSQRMARPGRKVRP